MINRQDVIDWADAPVTRAYFDGVREKIRQLEQVLGSGATLSNTNAHTTTVLTSKIVGQIEGYNDVLDIDMATIIVEDEK